MAKAQKIKASTQKFTEIEDIVENIVILSGQRACLVLEIQATNFSLLSAGEQQTKIYAYAQLLNSLSFPIQVLIRNKKIDISSYLKLLDLEVQKMSNEKLAVFIKQYRDFVLEMIKVNVVLDKKFYLIISFSALEKGVKGILKKEDFKEQAKAALKTKADSLLNQLSRLSLGARILEKEELIRLFYEIYNEDSEIANQTQESIQTPIIKTNL